MDRTQYPNKLINYTDAFKNKLRHEFKGSELIGENYSQSWQDMFALTMLDGKQNGTFLEIGAQVPIVRNNTFMLETFYNFSGISIDHVDYSLSWRVRPRSNFVCADALSLNYRKFLKNLPKQIDYCQVDIDIGQDQSLELLEKLMNSKHRFSVLTNETNIIAFLNPLTSKEEQTRNMEYIKAGRDLLRRNGYELLVKDVQNSHSYWIDVNNNKPLLKNYSFEDWWVDPSAINPNILEKFKTFNFDGQHPFYVIVDDWKK